MRWVVTLFLLQNDFMVFLMFPASHSGFHELPKEL